jgi:neurobeachin-like protein 1/2
LNKEIIFSTINYDNSIKITSTLSNLYQSLYRHKDLVTCLSICELDQYLVSGGKDTMLVVWEIKQIINSYSFKSNKEVHPKMILYGHDDEINDIYVNNDLNIVVSVSKDKTCILHSLNNGKYIRTITLDDYSTMDLLTVSDDGWIIIYSKSSQKIYLYSINGVFIKKIKTEFKITNLLTLNSKYIIYSTVNGYVYFRKLFEFLFFLI